MFRPDKCEVISVTRKKNPISYLYHIYGHHLKHVNYVKYLGVHITSDLRWDKHIVYELPLSSRNFYTWWTLSVIIEVTTWIISWSSLNYRVGQKVTKFGVLSDPTRKLSALTPERGSIL